MDPTLGGWPGNLDAGVSPDYRPDEADLAVNKARLKLVEALGEQSMWAVNLAEAKKSLSLITGPAAGLISCVRKIKRFDFVGATREFNRLHESMRLRSRRNLRPMSVPKGLKATPKAFANNWLAFHFGWEPLVKDIGAGIDTLCKPYPPVKVIGKSKIGPSVFSNRSSGSFWTANRWVYTSWCRMGCKVTVNNPNLYLAQQLGFVNPLSVVWELVPFSFVVDWFTNVGQILGQMSEFAGLSVTEAYTTRYQIAKTDTTIYYGFHQVKEGVYLNRSQFLADASLKVRPWKGVSVVRGATAIALLTQMLKG